MTQIGNPETAPAGGFFLRIDGSAQYLGAQIPAGDHPLRADAIDLLKRNNFQLDVLSRTWRLLGKHAVLNFLATHGETLRKKFRAHFAPEFFQRTARVATAKLRANAVANPSGGFDFSASLDTGGIPENILGAALARGQFYAETPDGKIALLPPETLAAAEALSRQFAEDTGSATAAAPLPRLTRRLAAADLADLENTLETLAVPFTPPAEWAARSAALRNPGALRQPPCAATLWTRLRLYQQIGAAWLWHLWGNRLGGVLADEMGLGKTAQALAFLEAASKDAPALVVCPAALVENWLREAARFTPDMPAQRHHGAQRPHDTAAWPSAGIVVTSYGTIARDLDLFRSRRWAALIADEAQHIKNARSLNARGLRSLDARSRFALTGTPVENSLDDLRSLFAFIMPGYLPDPAGDTAHERGRRLRLDVRARQKAAPYILRRAKQTVAPELPAKIEQTLCVSLEDAQATLYTDWLARARAEIFELEMSGAAEARVRLCAFTHLLRLRQICAEPRLLKPELAAADSAKFRALRELLDEAVGGGHRLLVFSQFAQVLRILRADLAAESIKTCHIDGTTRDRQAECDRFNADASIPVFLISLKAGGVGLNLTGADIVVHFDPWWNPAAEAQAAGRAHRIGQKRVVTSLRLVAAGTVEERVADIQREKAALLRDLFEASDAANSALALENITAPSGKVSLADMKALLGEM
ncbi:MAG: DEAD/DEAH box helicase [Puniceicoccales bacterium]|jgi:SNF2 family DNA or RNA helicase|nr:DEAD/DEAH box helicase [Puniceicoccales bacterium]